MKTRLIVLGLLTVVALATTSAVVAYQRGYRHGGDADRASWTLDLAPTEAWLHGQITARRDATKHPFLKSAVDVRADPNVNSIPTRVEF